MARNGESVNTSLRKAAAAGVLICMGCIVNLKAGGGIPGAILFSAGLWFVVNFDAELYTGRVTRGDYGWLGKAVMLGMNVVGAGLCGLLASLFLPEIRDAAQAVTAGYADPLKVIWQSFMCGICMYLATTAPKEGSRLPFVVYGVALFILSGGKPSDIPTIAGIGTIITAFFMGPLIEFFNVKIARPILNK